MYRPRERTVRSTRREFIVGGGVNPITAKEMYDSMHVVTTSLPVDQRGHDDCFFVKPGDDDSTIIIYFEVEEEK